MRSPARWRNGEEFSGGVIGSGPCYRRRKPPGSALPMSLPNCLEALAGRTGRLGLPPVTHAVVLLADGLGRAALEAHRGHARTLASRLDVDPSISAGLPDHDRVGSRHPDHRDAAGAARHGRLPRASTRQSDRVVSQLTGARRPSTRRPGSGCRPCSRRATADGVRCVAIASPRHRDSGFTRAVLRGADYRGEASDSPTGSRPRARELGRPGPVAHLPLRRRTRCRGTRARARLGALGRAPSRRSTPRSRGSRRSSAPGRGCSSPPTTAWSTCRRGRRSWSPPELLDGVRGTSPVSRAACSCISSRRRGPGCRRCSAGGSAEGPRAWVATRDEAIAAGWFGDVDDAVRPRIGDVLVAARKQYAYYVDPEDTGRRMVGPARIAHAGRDRDPAAAVRSVRR